MKGELLDRIAALALDAARDGFPLLGCALARIGAAAAINRESEAAELLADLSQRAADDATASVNAGPGSADRLQ